jgi:hypothetical protein
MQADAPPLEASGAETSGLFPLAPLDAGPPVAGA